MFYIKINVNVRTVYCVCLVLIFAAPLPQCGELLAQAPDQKIES